MKSRILPALLSHAAANGGNPGSQCRSGAARILACTEAEQALGQLTPLDQQFVQGLVQVPIRHNELLAFIGGKQRRLAHQLPDKGSAGAVRALDVTSALPHLEREPSSVEIKETRPTRGVRQRDLER